MLPSPPEDPLEPEPPPENTWINTTTMIATRPIPPPAATPPRPSLMPPPPPEAPELRRSSTWDVSSFALSLNLTGLLFPFRQFTCRATAAVSLRSCANHSLQCHRHDYLAQWAYLPIGQDWL